MDFPSLLPGDVAVFRDDPSPIFGLWPDFRIAWVNRSYLDFAAANFGPDIATRWGEGARLWDAVGEPLAAFYEPPLARLFLEGREWSHVYECSSPTRFRRFRMTVSPVGGRAGLLVVNTRVVDVPHDLLARPPREPSAVYVGEHGLVRMCASCRRVCRASSDQWDWVPAWVEHLPPNVTHGLCPLCAQLLYGDLLKARPAHV